MVDNGLGVTMIPEMAIAGGILEHTSIAARPLQSDRPSRDIALVWRKNSPREKEFRLLAGILRDAAQTSCRLPDAA
jgi:LysR family hydrogen peroxide-inducible transcriptional activator